MHAGVAHLSPLLNFVFKKAGVLSEQSIKSVHRKPRIDQRARSKYQIAASVDYAHKER
jgi:hypothetical protein